MEVVFANREKETISKNFEGLQRKHDQLTTQQSNWDGLAAATEKINMVYKLLENADDEEQQELRHHRDRAKALEADNTTLQKRLKELEMKVSNSDKAAATARQTLTQAQQRSMEWERRAKEYEGQLEMLQTKFEQAEQTQQQLEADYNLAKMQVEEQEADSRLVQVSEFIHLSPFVNWVTHSNTQDRETKMRDQITALESKCVRLQNELEKANAAAKLAAASPVPFKQHNGNTHPPTRPDSRASTIYDPRGNTSRVSSYSSVRNYASPQPETSVWDSMHAPSSTTPPTQNGSSRWAPPPASSRYPVNNFVPSTPKAAVRRPTYNNSYQRGAPSPTPSTVSVAPTQGDDGWWS